MLNTYNKTVDTDDNEPKRNNNDETEDIEAVKIPTDAEMEDSNDNEPKRK